MLILMMKMRYTIIQISIQKNKMNLKFLMIRMNYNFEDVFFRFISLNIYIFYFIFELF
ncbi:hypothetical protein C1645_791843 [Glomus cerebriforme]|uniref:Uncharacterized protein n=1 Tax=Glomus cerebriforme TaxID=658196 RepID=A0A397SDH4_9GLOM|nr:hypothetical protein C1645_791843 [Glomus cerebriforme]